MERTGNVSLKILVVEMNKQFLGEKCHLIIGIPSIIWSSYECILEGIFKNIVNRAIF